MSDTINSDTKAEKTQLHISVRNLVEFIFREGDIDNRTDRLKNPDAMLEGTRIHQKIQKSKGKEYMAEVPLSFLIDSELYELTIDGRADGIFTDREGTWIDEIKGMYKKVELMEEPYFVHQAQAMCYAYIFAWQNRLPDIGVQMTYCNMENMEQKIFRQMFSFDELEQWFCELIKKYRKWADFQCRFKKIRQESIKKLQFPFEYREGQKKLVEDVYRTILRQKNLFLQAPTGVGKTISTIFPAVKAVGENLADKIFYLTAKTITATVAKETFEILAGEGYRAKVVQITAKEKLCVCDEVDCNPVSCHRAKGHYDRVNDAVFDLLQQADIFTREDIEAHAEKYNVCPFEMCLDVSTWCDDIICDYNYVFDPNVYLKRFFQEGIKGDYIFLIDEAHNLVERSRDMYSAAIYKEDFLAMKKLLKPYSKKLEKDLDRCNKILLDYKRQCEKVEIYEHVSNLLYSLMRLSADLDEFLQKPGSLSGKSELLDFYFSIRNFLNIYDLVDEHYVIYTEIGEDGRFMMKLFCVDPSANLQNCLDKGKSTIFFSATLLPINYYKRLLSTKSDNYAIYAKSAFDQNKRLLLMGKDVSTRYSRRNYDEYHKMAEYIFKTIKCHKGNYMVFFPSYRLMEEVYDIFLEMAPDVDTIIQQSNMREREREEFLQAFDNDEDDTLVAFCIMGGIFGEGIDLKAQKLIGAIVVGAGLPQISSERDILKNYYDRQEGRGFDYAFRYPGINKVLQAAGRVIRTTEDYGVILLLDDRFLQRDYDNLYPREWDDRRSCRLSDVEELIRDFWKKI